MTVSSTARCGVGRGACGSSSSTASAASREEATLRTLIIAAEDGRIRELASRVTTLVIPRKPTCMRGRGAPSRGGVASRTVAPLRQIESAGADAKTTGTATYLT